MSDPVPTPDTWCPDPADSESTSGVGSEGLPAGKPLQFRYGKPASVYCNRNWSRAAITGLVRDLLVRHFAAGSPIVTELKRTVWAKDPAASDIRIESWYRWDPNTADSGRRELVIRPGSMKSQRLVIGDLTQITDTGAERFARRWVGSHTIFALDSTGPGVEALAAEAAAALTVFGPAIGEQLRLADWQVLDLGEVAQVEDIPPAAGRVCFGVPVTVGWVYDQAWQLERESVKLRKIGLRVMLDAPA